MLIKTLTETYKSEKRRAGLAENNRIVVPSCKHSATKAPADLREKMGMQEIEQR